MLLSRAGCKVTVLERQPYIGGRTSVFEKEGYFFDRGPTFFLYPRVLEEIYAACGRDLRREVDLKRLDPQYKLVFGSGGELNCTPDMARMEREIARLAPNDAPGLQRYMSDNRAKLAAFRPVLEKPFDSLLDYLSPSLLAAVPKLRPLTSVWTDISRYFSDDRVKLAFTFQSKYLGMSPFKCPSLFTILSYLEYEHGVWHPVGGCGALSRSMAGIAASQGAEIKTGEAVTEIVWKGKRPSAVKTAQGEYPCDALVVNGDFARTIRRLVPDKLRKRWSDRKLGKAQYSCSTFMLYLGLEGRYDHVAHHTVYLSPDYKKNLDEIDAKHILSDKPSFYVQNASVTDETLAPKGHSALYVLLPVTHQHPNVDWRLEAPNFRKLALKSLEAIGLDGIEKRIRTETMITPRDWDQSYEIERGAVFSLAHNFGQMLHRRPHNRFEDLDGVYLTGGGTHPGSGLPVIYESARISTRLMLEDLEWAPAHASARVWPGDALPNTVSAAGGQP